MREDDRPFDPPTPLDDASPTGTTLRVSDGATVRFTAGVVIFIPALFAFEGRKGIDDDTCCTAIGIVMWFGIITGVFAAGRWVCERLRVLVSH